MADDELIIRHVRLCECGLPADHDAICRPGRLAIAQDVDRAWEKENAEERAKEHEARQPKFRSRRFAQRTRMTNAELLASRAIRIAKLSPIAAGNIAPSHGNGGHPSVNLATRVWTVDLTTDPRWKHADNEERRILLRQHELLDEYEGHGFASADQMVTPEAKDAEIVAPHNEHLSAAEFARQFPGYGSPGTIARKRRWFRAGFCTFSGLPPRSECHCPTCRGAIT